MIDESLLFQMGFLFQEFSLLDVGLIIIFAFITTAIFSRLSRPRPVKEILPETTLILPESDDPDFESKTAHIIRTLIAKNASPHQSEAHTAREIAYYAPKHPLLEYLKELEAAEYRSRPIDVDRRVLILQSLEKSLVS